MGTLSVLLALSEGNLQVTDGFPPKGPVMCSFDVSFDGSQQTTEQTIGRWIEMSWCSFDVTVINNSVFSWKMEFIVYINSPYIVV